LVPSQMSYAARASDDDIVRQVEEKSMADDPGAR
jgi:hypothetical protein